MHSIRPNDDITTGEGVVSPEYHDENEVVANDNNNNEILTTTRRSLSEINEVIVDTISRIKINGHDDLVHSVHISPDNRRIVSGSSDNTIRIWDIETRKELIKVEGHKNVVKSVCFSPNGKCFVSCGYDEVIRIWDSYKGTLLLNLIGHKEKINCVKYSRDGNLIASGSCDHTVRIWDSESGIEKRRFEGQSVINSVCISPNGKRVISGSNDNSVRLWSLDSNFKKLKLHGHAHHVTCVDFFHDGIRIVSGSLDKTIRVWDTKYGTALLTFEGHTDGVNSVCISLDGARVASASADNTINIWDSKTGHVMYKLGGHALSVNSVTYSSDSNTLVSGGSDGTVRVWKAYDPCLSIIEGNNRGVVRCVSFSFDGKRVASGGDDLILHIWDLVSECEILKLVGHTKCINSVSYYPHNKECVVSGSSDCTIILWDLNLGCQLLKLEGHTNSVSAVEFSPDGNQILSASHDHTICMWDTKSGSMIYQLDGHTRRANSVSYSPDGKCFASGGDDGTCRIWNSLSGLEILKVKFTAGQRVKSVIYSPDGKYVACACRHLIRVFDSELGTTLFTTTRNEELTCVRYSRDGKHLLSGSHDGTTSISDSVNGFLLLQLTDHDQRNGVTSVNFSRDGKFIIRGCKNGDVHLWDNLLSRMDQVLIAEEYDWLLSQQSRDNNILSYICDHDYYSVHFKSSVFKGLFMNKRVFSDWIRGRIAMQDVNRILHFIEGLDSTGQLREHIYLLGRIQALERPVPQNLEKVASNEKVIVWMNLVLDHPFCKLMTLWNGILQVLHMFCFSVCSYSFQDMEGSFGMLVTNYGDKERIYVPLLIALLCCTVYYTIYEVIQGYMMYKQHQLLSWSKDFWNVVDFGCLTFSFLLFAFAYNENTRQSHEYRIVGSLGSILLWIRLLGYLKSLSVRLATFVLALFQIFADLQSFVIVMAAIMAMFCQAMYLLAHPKVEGPEFEEFSSVKSTLYLLFGMLIGEYHVEQFEQTWLLMSLNLAFMFMMTIVMLNMLIAIISDSYDAAIARSKSLYLRAKFQTTADMVLMFPSILEMDFVHVVEDAVENMLSGTCVSVLLYPFRLCFDDCDKCLKKIIMSPLKIIERGNVLHIRRDDEVEDEHEWLGKALDMEQRVQEIVHRSVSELLTQNKHIEAKIEDVETNISLQNFKTRELKDLVETRINHIEANLLVEDRVNNLEQKLDLIIKKLQQLPASEIK